MEITTLSEYSERSQLRAWLQEKMWPLDVRELLWVGKKTEEKAQNEDAGTLAYERKKL